MTRVAAVPSFVASLAHMDHSTDTNAAIWKSEEGVQSWTANTEERERKRAAHWRFMGELLPFGEQDAFTVSSGTPPDVNQLTSTNFVSVIFEVYAPRRQHVDVTRPWRDKSGEG